MTADQPYVPTFSPRIRTVTYVVCLLVAVLTALACTLLVTFDTLELAKGAAITGAVSTACAVIAAGFGVAYRPTRADIAASGIPVARHLA